MDHYFKLNNLNPVQNLHASNIRSDKIWYKESWSRTCCSYIISKNACNKMIPTILPFLKAIDHELNVVGSSRGSTSICDNATSEPVCIRDKLMLGSKLSSSGISGPFWMRRPVLLLVKRPATPEPSVKALSLYLLPARLRESIKKANPDMSNPDMSKQDVTKELARMWRYLSKRQKDEWVSELE